MRSKLFELGRLSSGRAAQLCGMDRVTFLLSLHRVGVAAIDLDEPFIALNACGQLDLLAKKM
jgi:hypothetical protein